VFFFSVLGSEPCSPETDPRDQHSARPGQNYAAHSAFYQKGTSQLGELASGRGQPSRIAARRENHSSPEETRQQ